MLGMRDLKQIIPQMERETVSDFTVSLHTMRMPSAVSRSPYTRDDVEEGGTGASAVACSGLHAKLTELHPRRFFLETWRTIDEEAAAEREVRRAVGKGHDWRPVVALSTGAVLLTAMRYLGGTNTLFDLLDWLGSEGEDWAQALHNSPFSQLYQLFWWSAWRVLGFFVLPAIVVLLSGERLRDQGLALRGFRAHAWIYLLCFVLVLPLVIAVSFQEGFTDHYPFYDFAGRSWLDFAAWELLYFAQFFALEFFFRGWWLRACKTMMGSHAIFAMVVPYCMLHFGKPVLETLAAIVAGIILGTLAMKTRSIWNGVLLHCSVALAMDVAALVHEEDLPARLWPGV